MSTGDNYPHFLNPVSPILMALVKRIESDLAWQEREYALSPDLANVDIIGEVGVINEGDAIIHLFDEDTGTWFLYAEVFPTVDAAQHFADCEIGGCYKIEKHGTGIVRGVMRRVTHG